METCFVQNRFETEKKDTMGLSGYIDWVEQRHSKNRRQNRLDDEWYKKRISWISRLRTMKEEAEKESEGAAIPDTPVLLIRVVNEQKCFTAYSTV